MVAIKLGPRTTDATELVIQREAGDRVLIAKIAQDLDQSGLFKTAFLRKLKGREYWVVETDDLAKLMKTLDRFQGTQVVAWIDPDTQFLTLTWHVTEDNWHFSWCLGNNLW